MHGQYIREIINNDLHLVDTNAIFQWLKNKYES